MNFNFEKLCFPEPVAAVILNEIPKAVLKFAKNFSKWTKNFVYHVQIVMGLCEK